jgi:hypothetical protein
MNEFFHRIGMAGAIFNGWLGLMLVLTLLNGCGKKAPPVAPQQAPLAAVSDLKGQLNQGTVRLTWHHSADNARAVGYIILRAQSALSQPECPECPLVYQKIDTIPMSRSLRKKHHIMEFYHDVADGFRYTFNVRPYASSGSQGPDSNPVVVVNERK